MFTELPGLHSCVWIARDWTAPCDVFGSSSFPSGLAHTMGKFSLMPVDVFPLVACMAAGAN